MSPLVVEVWKGLTRSAEATSACLGPLALQAAVLFAWWPKSGLPQTLTAEQGPTTGLAACIALGATFAYYCLRAGAEEFLLPGQRPLREWLWEPHLGRARLLGGYLSGHLVQTLLVIGLSAPLLLAAQAVAGGAWPVLAWAVVTAAAQGVFFRLAGAALRLGIGSRRQDSVVAVRVFLVSTYVVSAALVPGASHPLVVFGLFAARPGVDGVLDPVRLGADAGVPPHFEFIGLYGLASVVSLVLLAVLAGRERRRGGVAATAQTRVDTPR